MIRTVHGYDETDRLLESWATSHPHLDLSSKEVMLRLQVLADHLEALAMPSLERFGLKPSWFALLSELQQSGPPFTRSPGQLTESLGLTSGGTTNLLDRTEAAGFIQRYPDPRDRRGVVVQLTAAGQAALESTLVLQAQQEQVLLKSLSQRERASLTQILRKLLRAAEAELANTEFVKAEFKAEFTEISLSA